MLSALALSLVVAIPGTAPEEDPTPWFERLRSDSALERQAAQRWLATHLVPGDYPLLAARARDADPETARRLALALGSDDRHLDLVVLLLGEPLDELEEIGRQALDDLLNRWCPGITETSARRREVALAVGEVAETVFVDRARVERLELAVDRLARLGDLGLPLVLAPGIADREVRRAPQEGRAFEHLRALCAEEGLAVTGIGDWSDPMRPGAGSWILVSPKSGARSRTGADRIADWCRVVEAGRPGAATAARSLAASGWSAVLHWLDRRWSERRDEAALEGLLAAAAQGRVGRSLMRADERRALLERADRALDSRERELDALNAGELDASEAQRFAERVARALGSAGPMTLGGGDDSALLLEGWQDKGRAQRWLRLAVLEGRRGGGERVGGFLRALVEDPAELGAPLRFQALRALAQASAPGDGATRVARADELVAWCLEQGQEDELLVLFEALEVPLTTGAPEVRDDALLFALRRALRAGDSALATTLWLRCAQEVRRPARSALVRTLAAARLESGPRLVGEVAAAVLARSEEAGVDGDELARRVETCLLAGCLEGRRQGTLGEALEAGGLEARQDGLELLGALVAGPRGEGAERRLLALLRSQPRDPELIEGLIRALGRALTALDQAGLDDRHRRLRESVWQASASGDSPLHRRLGHQVWPPSRPARVRDLFRHERELPSRGL